jgi:hypothetical protein
MIDNNPNRRFQATSGGAIVGIEYASGMTTLSKDDGATWGTYLNSLPSNLTSLAISTGGTIIAGTNAMGVYRGILSTKGVSMQPITLSLDLKSYPNPFTEKATIEFTLKTRTAVAISIFNSVGALIYITSSKMLDAGAHSEGWTNRDLPSGVYTCRLSAGSQSQAIRLVHVR